VTEVTTIGHPDLFSGPPGTPVVGHRVLDGFHPAVSSWFAQRFPGGPTAPQLAAWPVIREGLDVLVASPTGTGKTLTGFLVAIDAAYRAHGDGLATDGLPGVLYVSPLRALATDVEENLAVRWPASPPRRRASD
jgi:ATP-dependent Lhr-like helicase